jgi:TRAP-type C4-dicarboxylate transport system permease small subunit
MTRESIRRALRTFIITTLALFIPGLLGWLNDVTAWAAGNGERPFPDGHSLVFLLVSACVAGLVAVINLVWNVIEDATGKGMLRDVPAKRLR